MNQIDGITIIGCLFAAYGSEESSTVCIVFAQNADGSFAGKARKVADVDRNWDMWQTYHYGADIPAMAAWAAVCDTVTFEDRALYDAVYDRVALGSMHIWPKLAEYIPNDAGVVNQLLWATKQNT